MTDAEREASSPGSPAAARAAADGRRNVIAIDGPAGTGKSTVSRAVAERLGAKYLDTGAMYRVATLWVLRQGIDWSF